MSNLDNIKDKIIEDAKAQVEAISKGAMEEITGLEKENNALIQKMKEEAEEKFQKLGQSERDKILSGAQLRARDEELGAKNDLLDRVFDMAKEKLASISDEDYLRFVEKTLDGMDLEGHTLLAPKGKKDLLQNLGIEIEEDENLKSGFALKKGDVISNYTFDALVDFYRNETEGEIASLLFDKEG